MNLTFTITVEVSDRYGEEHVPHVKHVVKSAFRNVAGCDLKAVQYEGWLTKPESHYQNIEETADLQGRLPL